MPGRVSPVPAWQRVHGGLRVRGNERRDRAFEA